MVRRGELFWGPLLVLLGVLFFLKAANGNQVCLFWDYVGKGMWFYLGLGSTYPQTYPVHIQADNLGWKKGETHHLALTWGDKTRMYVDGKLAAEADLKATFADMI